MGHQKFFITKSQFLCESYINNQQNPSFTTLQFSPPTGLHNYSEFKYNRNDTCN